MTPVQTIRKASRVPIETSSASTSIGDEAGDDRADDRADDGREDRES